MIEKLLDDFLHVEQSCSILSARPFDRPLVNFLHCVGGETVMVSRVMALLTMLLSMFVFIRFLHPHQKLKDFPWLTLVHPIILFPFFYASQLSSAVTVAWAVGGIVFFFHKFTNIAWAVSGALMLALVGMCVRFEAPYILIMMVGSVLVLLQSRDNLTFLKTIKKYFYRENIIKTVVLFGAFFIMKNLAQAYLNPNSERAIAMEMTWGTHYSLESWYNSQVLAVLHYIQNFIFPFAHSFYGNWQEYVWVVRTFESPLPMVVFLLLILGLLGWSYGSRILSENIRLLIRGLVMFVLIALVVSAIPRTEWYYPTRGHLAAVVLMGYVSVFVSRLKWARAFGFIVAIYLVASMGYATLFQYKNIDNMYAHDKFFYGDVHPFLRMELATREWNKGNHEIALQTWFNVYKRIPSDVAQQSNRAGLYKLLALYNGWHAYETTARSEESYRLLPELLGNTYFISMAVCLQDSRVDINECFKERDRIIHYCVYLRMPNIPPLKQAHPFRVDIEPHCLKLGIKI